MKTRIFDTDLGLTPATPNNGGADTVCLCSEASGW